MTPGARAARVLAVLLSFFAVNSSAQAPAAAPPPVPADVTPLYVVTYVESKPTARDETAALPSSYREGGGRAPGNLGSVVVRGAGRRGRFVVVAAWKDKAAWDAHMAASGTQAFREKLAALRNAPADDRFHNSLSVGPLDN